MRDYEITGSYQGAEEEYEEEDYNDYEEASEPDGKEQEDVEPSKEEQEYLKLREQLKEKYRQKLKKQSASSFGYSSQTQGTKRTVTDDRFGSFFGPSKPVIASRVIEESRSIRENHRPMSNHIAAKFPSSSSSNKKDNVSASAETRAHVHDRPVKKFNEIKKKVQTLKDTRDYSFLLSDDADFPDPVEEPVPRKVSALSSDGRSAQAPLKSKIPISKPSRLVSNGHDSKNSASTSQNVQSKHGSLKAAPTSKPKPTSVDTRNRNVVGVGNGSGRPVAHKPLPSKVPTQVRGTMYPPSKVMNGPSSNKNAPLARPHSSNQNHHPEQRRVTQGTVLKTTSKQPLPSSKVQPKQIPQRGIHEDRPKKRPAKTDDEDADAIAMIRNMFRYNPGKYRNDDQDDSDMEVGFESIQKEERRSAKIARKEDEEQLRLIEDEERRERMRKKQKK